MEQIQRRRGNLADARQPGGIEPDGRFGADAGQPFVGQRMQKGISPPGGTWENAAGLVSLEAIWLTSLLTPMPSLTVILSDCPMALRMARAMSTGAFRAPVRSK